MSKIGLIVVDYQNDYFQGGLCPLEGVDTTAKNAAALVAWFRAKQWPIIHVRHEFKSASAPFFRPGSEGAKIHALLSPAQNEPIVLKHEANSFFNTNLKQLLETMAVSKVVICGAMSHMCIDATVRAAHDLNYECILAHDACATRALDFDGMQVPAAHVHATIMAALKSSYAQVIPSAGVLSFLNSVM